MQVSKPDQGPDLRAEDLAALTAQSRSLPKVLLHEHLDGGLRVATLFDLLRQRGMAAPVDTVAGLQTWFERHAHAGSLVDYLKGFELTVAAMASVDAMQRVAFEAAQDALDDGCMLAEFRIAPLLFEPFGMSGDAVVEALLEGLSRSVLPTGLILCAMRDLPASETLRAAQLGLRFQGRGVVGFDLAGAEFGHPPSDHAQALNLVRDAGLPITLHAGEADVAERVLQAVRLGARRIGHGVRLADALINPSQRHLVDEVIAAGAHLEVCPTSNVHTGAAASIATHPITALHRAGVSVSFHTDNRLMSCITHSQEALVLLQHTPLTLADLLAMGMKAARASFLDDAVCVAAQAAITQWGETQGIAVTRC